MAEPGATIGFAGARVLSRRSAKKLPQGFQKAEFLLEHGFVDLIVPRPEQKNHRQALRLHRRGRPYECVVTSASGPCEGRATGLTYVEAIFDDFMGASRGSASFRRPRHCGSALRLNGEPVTVIAMEKGGDMKDKVRRNLVLPIREGTGRPCGMKQAEKFHRPGVVCFVDTSGAFCGLGAEEARPGPGQCGKPCGR